MTRLIERPYPWGSVAVAMNVLWAVLFWLVFIVGISWHVLRVPMGLGGAVYPALFILPVLVGSALYQVLVALVRRNRVLSTRQVLVWSLWVPFVVIALCLVVWCPMDADQSYLGYLWSHLW